MACLEMYNNNHHAHPLPMSPRISFSNDFAETHSHNSQHLLNTTTKTAAQTQPASSDFEFSVTNHNMLSSADELFSKGRLLPFKNNNNGNTQMQRTLRDELLVNDDETAFSLKPPKGSSSNRWKGFLGLRKSHIGPKKPEKNVASFDSARMFSFSLEDPNLTKSPQDMVSNEGASSNDMEMGI
ncbi:hypothetical protein BVRB_003380 [Beta vulgaris subsp. vulgaris]|uniref:Uncharacterized protein n=1 Tax=Beta vulgaris subsp. vulgaris TaxID=3555 RepID=A0A0J8B856_BETVV|nr:hypothetical protein BVRB_003380 [Beta vulgaris subsp. vulgaris]